MQPRHFMLRLIALRRRLKMNIEQSRRHLISIFSDFSLFLRLLPKNAYKVTGECSRRMTNAAES